MFESRNFTQGLNQDTDVRLIQNGQYIDALNIRAVSTDNGRDGSVENVKSNTIKNTTSSGTYTMPDGINRCIGNIEDELNSRTFYFVWNSEGSHLILMYDQKTDQITEVVKDNDYASVTTFSPSATYSAGEIVESSSGSGIYAEAKMPVNYSTYAGDNNFYNTYIFQPVGNYLDFKEDYLIQSRIVYKDEQTFILWTDNYNEEGNDRIRYINVDRALGNLDLDYPTNLKKEFFDVSPDAPLYRPTVDSDYDSSNDSNYIRGKFFQFKYRYVFWDGQPSPWSPYSILEVYDHNSLYSGTQFNNRIQITAYKGYNNFIKTIEVAARECGDGNSGDWHIIERIDATTSPTSADTTPLAGSAVWGVSEGSDVDFYSYTINWYNNGTWESLTTQEATYDYSFVPQAAKSLEILNDNRLSVANTITGYDLASIDPTNEFTLAAPLNNPSLSSNKASYKKTFKKGVSYQVGIRYSDGKGRVSTVIIDPNNYEVEVPWSDDSASAYSYVANITLTISNDYQPPAWAKTWQVVVRPSADISYKNSTPDFIQLPFKLSATNGNTKLPNLTSIYGAAGNYVLISKNCIDTWSYDHYDNKNISYTFTDGDRVRLYTRAPYQTQPTAVYDMALAGDVTTGGENFTIRPDSTSIGFSDEDMFEFYTTASTQSSLWYEMGSAKKCGYDSNEAWAHLAITSIAQNGSSLNDVDQVVGATNALTTVVDGDCYLALLSWWGGTVMPITDSSGRVNVGDGYTETAWADFAFSSRSNDRGRPTTYRKFSFGESYNGRAVNEARIHFSQPIVQETDRVDFSLMYDLDFVDNNIQRGGIQYMYQMTSNLYTFQEDRIGYRPVARQIIQSPSGGSGFVGSSGEILGDVSYLPYNYGISTNPESFAVYGGDMFCVDAKRNAVLRVRGNQIENIAANGMKFYFDDALQAARYYNQANIYGGYDRQFDEYIVCFNFEYHLDDLSGQSYSSTTFSYTDKGGESGALFAGNQGIVSPPSSFVSGADVWYYDSSDGYMKVMNGSSISEDGIDIRVDGVPSGLTNVDTTSARNTVIAYNRDTIAFSNKSGMWVSRYSFYPETIGSSQMRMATFKDGQLYVHNEPSETTYNKFYETYYASTIKLPFNAIRNQNKLYNTIGLLSDKKMSGVITNYSGQETNFNIFDAEGLEGEYWYPVLRDINTPNVSNPVTTGDFIIDDHAMLELTASQGLVVGATITNQGTGYTSAPTVTIGGSGSGATATAEIDASGRVSKVNITAIGSGYTSATISFSGGGGSGATATAITSNGLTNLHEVKATFNVSPTVTVNG